MQLIVFVLSDMSDRQLAIFMPLIAARSFVIRIDAIIIFKLVTKPDTILMLNVWDQYRNAVRL